MLTRRAPAILWNPDQCKRRKWDLKVWLQPHNHSSSKRWTKIQKELTASEKAAEKQQEKVELLESKLKDVEAAEKAAEKQREKAAKKQRENMEVLEKKLKDLEAAEKQCKDQEAAEKNNSKILRSTGCYGEKRTEDQGGTWPGDSKVARDRLPRVRCVKRLHACPPAAVLGGAQRQSTIL